MSLQRRGPDRRFLGRAGALVVGCTLVLTTSLLGLVALLTGGAVEPASRLPAYVLVTAVAFVAGVVLLEEARADGSTVLVTAGAVAAVAFVVVGLSVEGVLYASAEPTAALGSQLLAYLVGLALVGTGLGYWGMNHWEEVGRAAGRL